MSVESIIEYSNTLPSAVDNSLRLDTTHDSKNAKNHVHLPAEIETGL